MAKKVTNSTAPEVDAVVDATVEAVVEKKEETVKEETPAQAGTPNRDYRSIMNKK